MYKPCLHPDYTGNTVRNLKCTHLWREGFILVELVRVSDGLVVALLQQVFEQPCGRAFLAGHFLPLSQVITSVMFVEQSQLYAETRPPVIWTGKDRCGRVGIWVDGKKMKEQNKKVFQNHRCCQLCFRSECKWGHMYVCSPFQVITHSFKFVNWLNR